MASIPKRVSERLSKGSGRYKRVLKAAKDRDVNESDTVAIITDMLAGVFGFEKYSEITSEYEIRGTYCDLAVLIDGSVKYLVEVKAIGLDLKETHIRQAVNYGAQHGIQWVVLTNGAEWEIYRIKFERPIGHSLLCRFNFLELSPRRKEDQEMLFLLCKEGLTRAVIEEYAEHVKSVNKFVISAVLQSEPALNLVRRELKRVSPGIKVGTDEIQSIIVSDVLKRDVLEGKSAEKAKVRVKRAAGRRLAKRKPKPKPKPSQAEPTSAEASSGEIASGPSTPNEPTEY
ncbi:MAG: type I restriction enzyme HsdR N-terminal domain-containing protein [Chloroflexi bacterium]|nr:type I restriction enzyme HsdR N-terminal domain-containing protein [Chloroflexota bacterium]